MCIGSLRDVLNAYVADIWLTGRAQHIKYEASEHEWQNRPIVAKVSITELLGSVPYGSHFYNPKRNLLQQSHHLRLLICQLYLTQEHSSSDFRDLKPYIIHMTHNTHALCNRVYCSDFWHHWCEKELKICTHIKQICYPFQQWHSIDNIKLFC